MALLESKMQMYEFPVLCLKEIPIAPSKKLELQSDGMLELEVFCPHNIS